MKVTANKCVFTSSNVVGRTEKVCLWDKPKVALFPPMLFKTMPKMLSKHISWHFQRSFWHQSKYSFLVSCSAEVIAIYPVDVCITAGLGMCNGSDILSVSQGCFSFFMLFWDLIMTPITCGGRQAFKSPPLECLFTALVHDCFYCQAVISTPVTVMSLKYVCFHLSTLGS